MSDSSHGPKKTAPPTFTTATKEGIVIVEVGPQHIKHHVHKALLQHHSEYFRNALRGPWQEAADGVVSLEDVNPAVFGLFVHWLYTQRFPEAESEWIEVLRLPADQDLLTFNDIQFARCIDSYMFGDRFLAPEFRRAANNAFTGIRRRALIWVEPCLETVNLAFSSIPPSRIILQLIADDYRYSWRDCKRLSAFTSYGQNKLPRAMLGRVMRSYREAARGDDDAENDLMSSRCYLEHRDDEEKEGCSKKHMVYNEEQNCGYFN